jgi:hypothetical protein
MCSIKLKYLVFSSASLLKFPKAELTKDVDKVALHFRTSWEMLWTNIYLHRLYYKLHYFKCVV